jgi:hypothetical protein
VVISPSLADTTTPVHDVSPAGPVPTPTDGHRELLTVIAFMRAAPASTRN